MLLLMKVFLLELDLEIKEKIWKSADKIFHCYECSYQTGYYTTMLNHVESKHIVTAGFNCTVCLKFCPTRNALKSHTTKQHKYQ